MLASAYVAYRLVRWMKTFKRFRKSQRVVDGLAVCSEGVNPNSPLLELGKIPKGQVAVALKKDGNLHIVGGGIRVEDYLITPTHNTYHGYECWILHDSKEAKVDTETAIDLAADVTAFSVAESTWTRLGVAKVRLAPLRDSATVSVTSSCDRKYSVATLTAASPMGRVVYEGSTQPGFSGSVYMNGTAAVGMHNHGGVRGGGYELLYLYQRLRAAIDQPCEDSTEFMLKEARRGYLYEELGNDAVVVRFADGNYHRTKREILERMTKLDTKKWADEVEREELQEQLRNAPEGKILEIGFSGEGQRPVQSVQVLRQPADIQSLPDLASLAGKAVPQQGSQQASVIYKDSGSEKQLRSLINGVVSSAVEKAVRQSLNKRSAPTAPQICQAGLSGPAS